MATRDRTALFRRYRAEAQSVIRDPYAVSGGERRGGRRGRDAVELQPLHGKEPSSSSVVHAAALPPRWVDLHESIAEDLACVQRNLQQLRTLHGRLLLPSFQDKSGEEAAIDQLTAETARLFQQCESKVRQLSEHVYEAGISRQERTVRSNIQRKYAMQVQEHSAAFRREQKRYLQQLRSTEDGAEDGGAAAWQLEHEEHERQRRADDGDAPIKAQQQQYDLGFSSRQLSVLRSAEAHADERYREVTRISASIQDLASMVRDLATLVVEQGSVVDRIDYNLEHADAHTDHAVEHLRGARRSQKRGVMHYCTLCLSIGCVIMALLLLLKLFK